MSTHHHNDHGAHMSSGALLGIVLGIGIGILIAPRSGKETRDRMVERAMAAKQEAGQRMAQNRTMAMESINRSLGKAKDMTDKAANSTKSATDKTAQKAKRSASQAQADVNAAKRRRSNR